MAQQTPHYNVRQSASYAQTLGITQRATPLKYPWVGELRVRFSDFQVNEIGKDGSVLHLRQVGLGGDIKATQVREPKETTDDKDTGDAGDQSRAPESVEVSAKDVSALEDLVGPSLAQGLVELFGSAQGDESARKKSVTSEPMDRFKRGQVHQEIRRIFQSRIETSTDSTDAIVATLAAPLRRGQKRARGGRNHNQLQGGGSKPARGDYLHFTLFKDNRDTMDAVSHIARFLRVKPQVIGYAGTKDRRASTVQRCSVRYTRDTSLAGLNGRLRGIATGDYQYKTEPMRLGELLGNEFVITIKKCKMVGAPGRGTNTAEETTAERLEAMRSNVQSALDHMAKYGWINYFGHQRFGTHQIGTHQIGKLILADRFEDAVNSILAYDEELAQKTTTLDGEHVLEPSKRDEYARHRACMLFRTGEDIEGALELMPRRFTAEGCLMRHLSRQGSRRDFVGAVIHITRGLRSMYLHAYQSHVWNHAASKRWELHGAKVVKGDLVIVEEEGTASTIRTVSSQQDQDQDDQGDDVINPAVEDDDDIPVRARPLSEEEASSGRFTIHDVVLPTPGYDVVYPDNEIGDFYGEFMSDEANGALDPRKMRRLRREFSLPGRYRKLMHRFLAAPSVEFRPYADEEEQMHSTDLDRLNEIKAQKGKRGRSDDGGDGDSGNDEERLSKMARRVEDETMMETATSGVDMSPHAVEDQPVSLTGQQTKIAAIVKFQLGRSAYATVTLRELMGDPPVDEHKV